MVLLTMTPAIVEALERLEKLESIKDSSTLSQSGENSKQDEPVDVNEAVGESFDENIGETRSLKQDESTYLDGDSSKDLEHEVHLKQEENTEEKDTQEVQDIASTPSPESDSKPIKKEPSLVNPSLGNPISHSQIIDLWTALKSHNGPTLESLLHTSEVYIRPPSPTPEPTSEFLALMARLRRDEEARAYHRLTHPAPPLETFAQRFPLSSSAHAFSSHPPLPADMEDDITYEEVKRQIGLIVNVLVSFICCGFALWKVARWWSVVPRVALSLGGSLLVVVAEVVIYMGYLRRIGEAKGAERKVEEVKEVVRTWVVGGGVKKDGNGDESISIEETKKRDSGLLRQRINGS